MRALLIGVVTSRVKESKLETLESTIVKDEKSELKSLLSCHVLRKVNGIRERVRWQYLQKTPLPKNVCIGPQSFKNPFYLNLSSVQSND